ncbi:DUF4081 domain-containing protein [Saxibacter everestensis]|uniref:DUF4081 domain-containing protein n=1 Tax=Saxibacter everestensis TaxID=2909229 RepID=A0ABY8QVP6_9MICO|nr:DUF4081 domain-containing protein [Brevibacteriaceae bacterium ZFBP1038]
MGSSLRLLGRSDTAAVRALCDLDPVTNVFVAGRIEGAGSADPHSMAGELWGYFRDSTLVSALWNGANVIPVNAQPDAIAAFAKHLASRPRRCSSLVGLSAPVLDLASQLSTWPDPREIRANQPLMLLNRPPRIAADPGVTRARKRDLDVIFAASVAMFEEEVGYSPVSSDGGNDYRRRVESLISRGQSFARIEDDVDGWPAKGARQVVFKADIGASSSSAVQIQGVWVHPSRRGEQLAAPGMAAVAMAARREIAPLVSLYVNDYNQRALAAYRRVGFEQIGSFATVLF